MNRARGTIAAIAALFVLTLVSFVSTSEKDAVVLTLICAGGVAGAALVGFDLRLVGWLGLGLLVIVWFVWAASSWGQYEASAVAHGCAGALTGWITSSALVARGHGFTRGVFAGALLVVAFVGLAWELAELAADSALAINLSGGALDTALDLVWDLLGGALGALLVARRANRSAV